MNQHDKTQTEAQTRLALNGGPVDERIAALERRISQLEEKQPDDQISMVVFSGDLDRVMAAFVIATGAAPMGQKVRMFFTFWGLNALRSARTLSGKGFFEKAMAIMLPSSTRDLPVSRMNFFGVGAKMLRTMMAQKNVASLEDLIAAAREMGVQMISCEMSRDVMGIRDAELMGGLESGGVATFMGDAVRSRVTLFI